jgi:hypothetical protein
MTTKEIIKGLKYRLRTLKKGHKVLMKPENNISPRIIQEYENRIDEIESMVRWIKENEDEK